MTYVKRNDKRAYEASVDDGRGLGWVTVVDGYGRFVSDDTSDRRYWCTVVGVHTRDEAVAAAKAEGLKLDGSFETAPYLGVETRTGRYW
jgi:hypothetical protein